MKYLKKFESFELSHENDMFFRNKEEFTEEEFNDVKKIVSPLLYQYKIKYDEYTKPYKSTIDIVEGLDSLFELIKCEDSWYFIYDYSTGSDNEGFVDMSIIYKCDQYDGFLDCLKQLVNKAIEGYDR